MFGSGRVFTTFSKNKVIPVALSKQVCSLEIITWSQKCLTSTRLGVKAKFNPPECFPFHRPNDWADWKQCFQHFRSATKLDKEDGEVPGQFIDLCHGKLS